MAGVGSFFRLERQGTTPPFLPPFEREFSPSAPDRPQITGACYEA